MKSRFTVFFIVLSLFLLSGCQSDSEVLTTSPVESQMQLMETTLLPTIDSYQYDEVDPVEAARTCDDYAAYRWLVDLRADEVDYIEFVNLNDLDTPYRRYEGKEIDQIIDLFQRNTCVEYKASVSWQGYFTQEFHIVLKDGTAHTVCSIQNAVTVIDGAAFDSAPYWIGEQWPYTGDSSLPTDWENAVASRNYHVFEEEVSFLGSRNYDVERFSLDQQYDTSTFMGSDSRNYPIGRGTVTLAAKDATTTGVTLDAYWTGTFRGGKLSLMPKFWLEKWVEDPQTHVGSYVPLEAGSFRDEYTPDNTAQNAIQWRVLWGTTIGSLEAGHYRIGMTFYEQINGSQQNATPCYAKFVVK